MSKRILPRMDFYSGRRAIVICKVPSTDTTQQTRFACNKKKENIRDSPRYNRGHISFYRNGNVSRSYHSIISLHSLYIHTRFNKKISS